MRNAAIAVKNRKLDWFQLLVNAARLLSNSFVSVKSEERNSTLWSNMHCEKANKLFTKMLLSWFEMSLLNQGASAVLLGCKGILICFYRWKVEEHFCSSCYKICPFWVVLMYVCVCVCVHVFVMLEETKPGGSPQQAPADTGRPKTQRMNGATRNSAAGKPNHLLNTSNTIHPAHRWGWQSLFLHV